MNLKKTKLYDLHKKHSAKFVSFAGYEMPIHYKDGIIAEHNFTREKFSPKEQISQAHRQRGQRVNIL